jgi:hypothetical protein
MSDEIKKPEETADVPPPESPKVLSESDLKEVVGGAKEISIMKVLDKTSPLLS